MTRKLFEPDKFSDVLLRTIRLARRGPKPYANYLCYKYESRKLPLEPKYMPPIIYIEPIRACNLRCPMCLRQWRKLKDGLMKLSDFEYIVQSVKNYVIGISFAGWGEWFLHKDFPAMLALLDEENIPCDFITNATLLKVEALRPLLKPGNLIVKIGVSMDSPTTGRIREYPEKERVLNNIRQLIEIKRKRNLSWPLIRFRVTLMKVNADEVLDIIDLAKNLGIDRVDIFPVVAWNSRHLASPYGPLSDNELNKLREKILSYARVKGVNVYIPSYIESGQLRICEAPWKSVFISWNGDVHPCCFYLDKVLGNIFEEPLDKIWRGREYREFRRALLQGEEKFCLICMRGEFWRNEVGLEHK